MSATFEQVLNGNLKEICSLSNDNEYESSLYLALYEINVFL